MNINTLPSSFKILNGKLFCESVEIDTLASKYGTPIFVYSERAICEAFLKIKNAVEKWPVEISHPGNIDNARLFHICSDVAHKR